MEYIHYDPSSREELSPSSTNIFIRMPRKRRNFPTKLLENISLLPSLLHLFRSRTTTTTTTIDFCLWQSCQNYEGCGCQQCVTFDEVFETKLIVTESDGREREKRWMEREVDPWYFSGCWVDEVFLCMCVCVCAIERINSETS